jgi:hypothetical protein
VADDPVDRIDRRDEVLLRHEHAGKFENAIRDAFRQSENRIAAAEQKRLDRHALRSERHGRSHDRQCRRPKADQRRQHGLGLRHALQAS